MDSKKKKVELTTFLPANDISESSSCHRSDRKGIKLNQSSKRHSCSIASIMNSKKKIGFLQIFPVKATSEGNSGHRLSLIHNQNSKEQSCLTA